MSNEQSSQTGPVKKFLWWLTGATIELLAQCPTDHRKYSAIGVAMLIVPSMAAFSSGFAVHETFDSLAIAVVVGCVWFLLVFNVDRLLLISIRKKANDTTKEFLMALPRLVMIVILSILITEPLLHRLFSGEIANQLSVETNEVATQARQNAEAVINPELRTIEEGDQRINNTLERLRDEREAKRKELMAEGEGTGGTLRPGRGQFYREKEAAYLLAVRELDSAKASAQEAFKNNESRRKTLLAKLETAVSDAAAKKANAKGFLAKHSALMAIARQSKSAGLLYFAISLALILLESTPLTIKLFSKRGHYDQLLESREQEAIYRVEKTLEENKKRLDISHEDRIGSSTTVQRLKAEKLDKVSDAIRRGDVKSLSADEAEIAILLSATVKREVLNDLPNEFQRQHRSDESSSIPLPEKPTVVLLHIHEPEEQFMTVNFNRSEADVSVHDLLFALRGLKDSDPSNGVRPSLTDYQFRNDGGRKIEMTQGLFSQLGGSRVVHLTLDAQNSSDATN